MSEPITPGEDGGSASMAERTTAVTAIELLLDLVFVAAIGQLASTLHDDVSWRGGVETVVLWVPLYLLWAHTTFSATGTITENKSARRPILCVLFFGIFMAAGIPVAFEDGSGCLAFVAPYLIAQLGQVALTWSIHGRPRLLRLMVCGVISGQFRLVHGRNSSGGRNISLSSRGRQCRRQNQCASNERGYEV